jgi:hypothetical protein
VERPLRKVHKAADPVLLGFAFVPIMVLLLLLLPLLCIC